MAQKWKKDHHKSKGVAKTEKAERNAEGKDRLRKTKQSRRGDEDSEIKQLEARIIAEAPKTGCGIFGPSEKQKGLEQEAVEGGPALTTQLFQDLPISQRTLTALKESNFVKMTEIQRGAIPHALAGRDVLGEARTGSGKTLAFLVPLIELLFRSRWTGMDGLGGLVVSPTRELSYQIYQVLVAIGAQQDLSAGCTVGGRDLGEEQQSVTTMNILVATPGRLLQHLDESPGFDASNVQIMVLDEADRILDFGFQDTIRHILAHVTRERQTMLFSATLHTSVHRLGKMALKSPEICSVHKDAKSRTPEHLKQVYMTVPLEEKIDVLFSFLRSHSQKKIIVFVSACKQVRFLYESFRQLKPGPAIMELHGKQSLTKRLVVFEKFSEKDRAVALFCTDIAARGVDFPAVDWVLQFDCPDTVESYVHRVGRTARFESGGNSALFLLPSEEAFMTKLKTHRVHVKSISAKKGKVKTIQSKIQAVIAGDPSIKHLAQKALISYVRSVGLMKDKEVFKVQSLPLENFAYSLGLAGVPEGLGQTVDSVDVEKNPIKMKKNQSALQRLKDKIKAKKDKSVSVQSTGPPARAEEDSESDELQRGTKKKLGRWERRQRRIERMEATAAAPKVEEEEDDLLIPVAATTQEPSVEPPVKKRKLKLGRDGVAVGAEGKHTFFGSKSSNAASEFAQLAEDIDDTKSGKSGKDSENSRQAFLKRVAVDLAQRDGDDAVVSRARIHEMHQKNRRKGKEERRAAGGEDSDVDTGVQLGGASSASSRSPSPCPSEASSGDYQTHLANLAKQSRDRPAAAGKVTAGRHGATDPRSRLSTEGGQRADVGDDLGALEKQVLSRLSGLF